MTIISASFGGIRYASGPASAARSPLSSMRNLQRAAFQQRREHHQMARHLDDLARKLELLERTATRHQLASRRVGAALSVAPVGVFLSRLSPQPEYCTCMCSRPPYGSYV